MWFRPVERPSKREDKAGEAVGSRADQPQPRQAHGFPSTDRQRAGDRHPEGSGACVNHVAPSSASGQGPP